MLNSLLFQELNQILLRNLFTYKRTLRNLHVFTHLIHRSTITNQKQSCITLAKIPNCNSNMVYRFLGISRVKYSEVEPTEQTEKKPVDPAKDRTKIIPPETSIRYLKSKAYEETYGNEHVWIKYRRNFKGQFVPRKTRKTCIRDGVITTGNPCPLCRDEYLVLHYTNTELLKQFIHPQTGEIIDSRKTHVCQRKQFQLEIVIWKAKLYGLLTYEVPFREYDYKDYYPNWKDH